MELIAETVFAIGFGILTLVYLVSVIGSLSMDLGEVLKAFLIPGYALMIAWRNHTWLKNAFITGCALTLAGLILAEFS